MRRRSPAAAGETAGGRRIPLDLQAYTPDEFREELNGLGYLGMVPVTPTYTLLSRVLSVVYFAFFILMPWYSKIDKCKPEPDRVTFK